MKVSVKTISEITGFSTATVSNALNNKRGVNRETAEKIFAVAKEQGYNMEVKITNIKLVIFKESGLIVSDTPFFSALIDGIEMEARNAGYEMTICTLDRRDPDYVPLRDQLMSDASSALILLATEMHEEDMKAFASAPAPVIVLDNWFVDADFSSVLINNEDSALQAVKYLIEKGHKKIGYLQGGIRINNFCSREKAYKEALQTSGLMYDSLFTFALKPTMAGAYKDMCACLNKEPELPTAFFADNDIIAVGAMKALAEFGYRIPEDISIVGFDDMPFSSISDPPLTTIRVFKREMAQTAVKNLIDLWKNDTKVKMKILICTEFIERESVADVTE